MLQKAFKLDLREIGWAPYPWRARARDRDVPEAHLKPAYERRTGA